MVVTDKQLGINYRKWTLPAPDAVVLLVHALGGHYDRWEFMAQELLKNNIASFAIDLRGFGRSEGVRGHVDSFKTYFNDIRALRGEISAQYPSSKVFLIGESLGGLISFLMACAEGDLFDGVVCISPGFKSRFYIPLSYYLTVPLNFFLYPEKQYEVYINNDMGTRDRDYINRMESDSREHNLASASLLFRILLGQFRAHFVKKRLSIPVLFLLSGKDKVVDSKVSRDIFKGLVVEDKTLNEYPHMEHCLSIDLDKEAVFSDIYDWISLRCTEK